MAVSVDPQAEVCEVSVADGSSILPAVANLASAEGGVGLRLVDALSREWGVEQTEQGKRVWAKLSLKPSQ